MLALEHDRLLVVAVALVTSEEFCQMIIIFCSVIIFNADICRCGAKNCTGLLSHNTHTGVNSSLCLHTCSNNRSIGGQKRHCLTLHV